MAAEDEIGKKKDPAAVAMLEKGLASDSVPKIYASGFGVGLGNADVFLVLQRFAEPVAHREHVVYARQNTDPETGVASSRSSNPRLVRTS